MNAIPKLNAPHDATRTIQPAWVRIAHWLNALAAALMMLSGWRIYDASPVFQGFRIRRASRLAAGSAAHCNGTSRRCGCCSATRSSIWC